MAVTSTFDTDAENWTVNADVASFGWSGTGGDPGGYLQWTDAAQGQTNYFVAPTKFLGDQAGDYGGTLSWSVLDNGFDADGQAPDVKITGDGITITRLVQRSDLVANQWNNFSVSLNETGWQLSDGTQPTAGQMQAVLGDITDVELLADYHNGADQGGLDNVSMACYRAGTAIRTPRGDVAVEDLAVGDRVVTSSGTWRTIRWLGHRRVDCRRHVRPDAAWPIRVAADAIGPNRPARDLYVSPGHAICFDVLGEVLIPAAALVNGTSVVQVEVDAVDYWHVELDAHDIILAENLAAESYIDCGNRGFFVEGGRRDGGARSAAAADSRAPDRAA